MTVVVERRVRADAGRVWELVGAVTGWAGLLPTVDDVAVVRGGPGPEPGSRFALRQPGLPRLVYEVTECVPGERFTWVASAPGVRTTGTHTITSSPDGCLLRLTIAWSGPLRPLVEVLFGTRTRRYVEQEADAFAWAAEGHPPAP